MAERTCIVTREVCDPVRLIRFVAGPDGSVVPDLKRNLPGRGVWVTARHDCVAKAAQKSLFARGLKAQVKAGAQLADQVEDLLRKRVLSALGIACKAGQCITGSGKVDTAIRSGKAVAVLLARDGSSDALRKLTSAATFAGQGKAVLPIIQVLNSRELSLALGATHVVHAALMQGGAAQKCLSSLESLAAYQTTETKPPGLMLAKAVDKQGMASDLKAQ
ncbi:MAG: RNA-binding protein [Ahrensia sp.]|nr:RNA-binding protein [Ahrensia sp.]